MSQWKNDDSAANSVSYVGALVNKTPNTGNQTDLFGNTTPSAFVTGQIVGQFGVDATEAGSANGTVAYVTIKNGSGYSANATLSVSGGAGNTTAAAGNAHANSSGRIDGLLFSNVGVDYTSAPTFAVSAPAAVSFNPNTGIVNATESIAISTANSKFLPGDKVLYLRAAGNTAVTGLSNGSYYYVSASNTTTVTLSATLGGANLDITASDVSETGHTLTGETAEFVALLNRGKAVAHSGWNLRRVGTGGRAGRVHYECLVAMGSMSGDASDDAILKDS